METDSFTCGNNQNSFKINYMFYCNEKCLNYLITYNRCLKQYLHQGMTQESLKEESTVFKDTCMKIPGHSGVL